MKEEDRLVIWLSILALVISAIIFLYAFKVPQ
jgi:hypothetical protein